MSSCLRARAALVAGLVVLQAADFLFTYLLLGGAGRGNIYEANPLARSVLEAGGWAALALFKLALTALALGSALAVARHRPAAGLRLLAGMCLLMLAVNAYSGSLLAAPAGDAEGDARGREDEKRLARKWEHQREFVLQRDRICDQLLRGEIDAREAMQRTAACVRHYGPLLELPPAGRLPDPERVEQLASYVDYQLPSLAKARPGLAGRMAEVRRELAHYFAAPAGGGSADPLAPPWVAATPTGLAAN